MIARVVGLVGWALGLVLIAFVWSYRLLIRPLLPPLCRFEPSCSEYFIQAVRKHGPICGAGKGIWRVCRCNPWNRGGYDPP
jgi:putative membrane protein insertion efficiency factor